MMIHVELAKGTRKCHCCNEKIPKGQPCLRFQGGWGPNQTTANICKKCILVELPKTMAYAESHKEGSE